MVPMSDHDFQIGDRVEVGSLWRERPYSRPGHRNYRPGRHATGFVVDLHPAGIVVEFDCGLINGLSVCTATPLELTHAPEPEVPGVCNTPTKRRFRSQADARRWWRRAYFTQGKPRLWPYRCPAGDHWHLTHHSPQEQRRLHERAVRKATPRG